ncbi:MAG TPA: TetR/AcrR family transcriptional regulator [Polyangiaceae bacterium]|jgi:AcrR family transcriptional regulator|nr:TetR/AcrR family transcriptional regulator [Polyangiaceae bacterium]
MSASTSSKAAPGSRTPASSHEAEGSSEGSREAQAGASHEGARGRRERILGAAERLFRHYGPGKTTVADIARACGIGVGSVYLDFSSKEAILFALATRRSEEIVLRMRRAAEGAAEPHERVRRMLVARVEAFLDMAEDGAHACDLVRCSITKHAVSKQPPSAQEGPPGFGADARDVLRSELVAHLSRAGAAPAPPPRRADVEVEAALDAIELAFVALGPPYVTRLERARALALARALADLLVYGV